MFTLMGGIAMFLYGMDLMGKALEQTAGSKLQGILSKMTASPVRGLLLGMVITAVIQSSGATTVMAVGFVNSGLMELHQAIGVIMGANIGTTVTGWLLSLSGLEGDSFAIQMLNPNAWAPILGFIGIFLYMLGKDKDRSSGVGKIMVGFSVLMAGMNTMSTAMSPLADEPWFMDLFLSFKNPVLGVLAGAEWSMGREARSKYGEPSAPDTADGSGYINTNEGHYSLEYRRKGTEEWKNFGALLWCAVEPGYTYEVRYKGSVTDMVSPISECYVPTYTIPKVADPTPNNYVYDGQPHDGVALGQDYAVSSGTNTATDAGTYVVYITPADGKDNFLYMVLPVRLRAGQ